MAKKMPVRPLFDNVLVKPLQAEEVLPSGIVLPDTAKEKPQIGEVMAIGPGKVDEKGKAVPMVVHVGDHVLYKKWGGDEVKVSSEQWMLVKQEDIMAIVD